MGHEMKENPSHSYFNPVEITIVVGYVEKLIDEGVECRDIGIITPYSAQANKIQNIISARSSDIKVGTVEKFQGQEQEVLIISTVRSSPDYLLPDGQYQYGFLKNSKKNQCSYNTISGSPY